MMLPRALFFGCLPAGAVSLVSVALSALIFVMIWCFGHWQYSAWDWGCLTNAAWHIVCGHRAYSDFYITFPPSWYLPAAWAFDLFGVKWSSIVLLAASAAAVTFLFQVFMLRRMELPLLYCLLIPWVVQTMSTVPLSAWWYNPNAAVAAALCITATVLIMRESNSRLSWFCFIVTLTWLLWQKPNVAGLITLTMVLSVFTLPSLRKKGIFFIGLSGLVAAATMVACGINPFDVARTYYLIAHTRALPALDNYALGAGDDIETLRCFIATIMMFVPAVMAWLVVSEHGDKWGGITVPYRRALVVLCLGSLVTGVHALFSNFDWRLVDAPPIFMATTMAMLALLGFLPIPRSGQSNENNDRRIHFVLSSWIATSLTLSCLGIEAGYTRQHVKGSGEFYDSQALVSVDTRFSYFDNVQISQVGRETVRQLHDLITSPAFKTISQRRIYFGPRLEWAWAAFGIPAPTGLPIAWYHGINIAPEDEPQAFQHFWNDFDAYIFWGGDYTLVPLEASTGMRQRCRKVKHHLWTVFLRKTGPGGAATPPSPRP